MASFGYGDFPENIFDLAFVRGYSEGLPELRELAEEEDWEYRTRTDRPNPILTNYVSHTYKRLVEENKIAISGDGQKLCFNTGLVTENQDEIFALFEPNRWDDKPQKWFLTGWRQRVRMNSRLFQSFPTLRNTMMIQLC